MHKKIYFFLFLLLTFSITHAQLQSPEQFLGYKIGSRYTPHWRIVDYYKHAAAAVPGMVKLQQYGETNEGRPLMVAYVGTTANISNLEAIRINNLKLTGLEKGAGNTAAPALVWLSYNVHGNETSSSEAAMITLHAMVDPSNTKTKSWLQNTLVIIDPCLNPDGRDRYVSWFTSVVGKNANPQLQAREHREPWPGGRTNHYHFDLNRDWAWQTQVESQARVKLYNQWLPHIHVDFHEQGINSPYYFAPAAEPFHEVITPWQRNFQNIIGRNHAKYFDEQGWLYFTKERFDLLYPSYGDTYPTYNGAIGMTYEQGGGPAGGTAVITGGGDTLTLTDRIMHHYTTGISTIEVASVNAAKLVTEFQNFYKNVTLNGLGEYKTYVVKYNNRDAERIDALLRLLRNNKIAYSYAKGGTARGYNYDTGKEENFTTTASDIIVAAAQPKGTLLKVLFEPVTNLSDSATYDITAWSVPYAYGLKAYASKQALPVSVTEPPAPVYNAAATAYGYVLHWNGVQSVKLATALMQKGIKLRSSQYPFEVAKERFERGAVIIVKTGNQYYNGLWDTVRQMATRYNVPLTPITSGFVDKGYDIGSEAVRPLANRRVAMITGEGISSLSAGEVWHFFDQELNYPITLINAADMARITWTNFDVLILPDGNYRYLADKSNADNLKNWVAGGGKVVAIEGAVAQLARQDWTIKSKKEDDDNDAQGYELLKKYENRERDEIPAITPGSIYKVTLDNTHPLAFGYPDYYYTLKQDDAIYQFIKEGGWNVGVLKKGRQVAGFVGSRLQSKLQDGLLFGVQDIGLGHITYLADDVLFRSFWEGGKLMFCNAVFLVGQ